MKITAKAQAVEFTVTGENDVVLFSHKAENVETSGDIAEILKNLSSLAHLFKQLDATHREAAVEQAQDAHAAEARTTRMQTFIDSIEYVIAVAREEQLTSERFDALCEQAERLIKQPEFVVNDLVDVTFDMFDAQTSKHWDSARMTLAMKAMANARGRRRG